MQAHFGRLREHARRYEQQQWTGSARARGSDRDGAAVDVETEARRAALDFFVSLLRDVASFFPETGGAAAAAAAEVDADVEAQSAGFVAAQPAQSRAFLADFCHTQMFLCFVQPQRGDRNLRGGSCFQLALERFLRARIAAEHGGDLGALRAPSIRAQAVPSDGSAAAAANPAAVATAAAATAAAPAAAAAVAAPVHVVPLPRMRDARHAAAAAAAVTAAAAAGGPLSEVDSFPLAMPPALEAVEVAMPTFVGEEPPPLQVSAELRTAWADALTSLEARQQERQEEQVKQTVAGVGAGVVVTTVAALACCVQ